jgi:hypothetical protein
MGKASKAKQERRTSVAQVQKKTQRSNTLFIVVIVTLVVVGGAGIYFALSSGGSDDGESAAQGPPGTQRFPDIQGKDHRDGTIQYDRFPPPGGPHNPVWQNCGFYDSEIRTENAVHSLEHGAVWITYPKDLDKDGVAKLRDLAGESPYVLVSPSSQLDGNRIFATAWGFQLEVDSPDDPRLSEFIADLVKGPDTPEPNASCTGGVGTPS